MLMQKLIENMGRPLRMLAGISLALLMGLVDYLTGNEMSFSIFYLLPILIAAWYSGKIDGLIMALLCSVLWLLIDIKGTRQYSQDAIMIWNAFVRFGFFTIFVFLVCMVRKFHDELEQKVAARTAELTSEIAEREKTQKKLSSITNKLRLLTKRVHLIREEENKIIAREIHDELGQALTAIKIDVAWLSKKHANDESFIDSLFSISSTIDDTIKTVRRISTRLRPRLLDELGLFSAMEWQVKEFQNRTGINCSLILPEDTIDKNSTMSSAVFRIFQEALTNVSRHSKTANMLIKVTLEHKMMTMLVKDYGIGLPENYLLKEHALGILGMQERAYSLGGKVEVRNSKEGGTEVIAQIPIKNESKINKND
jgi:signal transduction histidine kinase